MKKFSLLTLFLALCLTWTKAQVYNVTVSGTVTDISTGAPVANYPVDVVFDTAAFLGWGYYNTVLTDVNGDYSDVVAVPGSIGSGTGYTGLRDCTPAGYLTDNFTYSTTSSTISNLDFQICTTPSGSCNAMFGFVWQLGTTLVDFTDYSSGSGTVNSWAWDFGDGGTSTLQNPTHAYNSMGVYTVCLTIGTTTGCTATYCDSVYMGSTGVNCNSSMTASVAPAGVTTFSVTASGTGTIVGYFYDFGDGNTLSSTNATENHTYTVNGTYIACVDVLFSDSCISRSCVTVTIGSAFGCTAGFYWYQDTTGQYSIIVVNTSGGSGLLYSWSFGDGSGSTSAYPTHTYAGPGTYIVCVTITSNNGCTDTYCDSLVVVNKVSTPFTINVIASGATAVDPGAAGPAVTIYPNPTRNDFQVDVTLEHAAPVSVSLYDLSGRVVAMENAGDLSSGKHGIRLHTEGLPAGMYLARVNAGNSSTSHKVMIAR